LNQIKPVNTGIIFPIDLSKLVFIEDAGHGNLNKTDPTASFRGYCPGENKVQGETLL
jgi:hypothetical protein